MLTIDVTTGGGAALAMVNALRDGYRSRSDLLCLTRMVRLLLQVIKLKPGSEICLWRCAS